jgi:phospholipid transport system substrate-binding protein
MKVPIMRTPPLAYGLAMLLFASLAAPCYGAAAGETPSAFIAELAHQALLSVNSKTLSAIDRHRRFEELLDADFDVPRIASFVLGHYWKTASDAERQEFTAVFRDSMIRSYSRRFTEYGGDSFRVVRERAESASSTVVYSEISQPASGQPVKVEWHVIDRDGFRIIDVSVGGMSMALAQREEFSSALQRSGGDVASLIRQLQVKMSAPQSP